NSPWSASLLAKAGVPDEKLRIVPLAYRPDPPAENRLRRSYPETFSSGRPLRLLFLCQVNLRKGALELIASMRRLSDATVELLMCGPLELGLQADFSLPANINWVGPVSRSAVEEHYREADLFVLPTHSDGFAITQLEALARHLPIIASCYCGDVVI